MSGDDHRQPGPILGQIPHLQRPAKLPDEWHCKQLPNGANPIIVCERAVMLADVERLRALITEWDKALDLLAGIRRMVDPEGFRLASSRYDLAADALKQEARRG